MSDAPPVDDRWVEAMFTLVPQSDGSIGGVLTYDGCAVDIRRWKKVGEGQFKCQFSWRGDPFVDDYVARNAPLLSA